jgi:hypothetical protein
MILGNNIIMFFFKKLFLTPPAPFQREKFTFWRCFFEDYDCMLEFRFKLCHSSEQKISSFKQYPFTVLKTFWRTDVPWNLWQKNIRKWISRRLLKLRIFSGFPHFLKKQKQTYFDVKNQRKVMSDFSPNCLSSFCKPNVFKTP